MKSFHTGRFLKSCPSTYIGRADYWSIQGAYSCSNVYCILQKLDWLFASQGIVKIVFLSAFFFHYLNLFSIRYHLKCLCVPKFGNPWSKWCVHVFTDGQCEDRRAHGFAALHPLPLQWDGQLPSSRQEQGHGHSNHNCLRHRRRCLQVWKGVHAGTEYML